MSSLNPEQLELTEQLKLARGKRFGELLKQTYYSLAPELVANAKQIIQETGKISVNDVARLAIAYNLCLKHCFEFLQDPIDQVLSSGTYRKLLDRGLKPKSVMDEMRKSQS